MTKIVAIGCDHAGFDLKVKIIEMLQSINYQIIDCGCHSNESVDYPDMVHPVGKMVNNSECSLGIVVCGSGNGVNMTVNKYQNVRSALCWTSEIASLARLHNDANILALPARYLTTEQGLEIVGTFIETEFEGGRHQNRVDKINKILP